MFEDTTGRKKFQRAEMTFTPNLPPSMRRLYALTGAISGIAALAIPSLELFERGILAVVGLTLLVSAWCSYCALRALLRFGAKRK